MLLAMESVAMGARDAAAQMDIQHLDVATSDFATQTDQPTGSDPLMDKLATTASSRDDDDMKGSDSWRLQSDASTISSRATTPDLHPPPESRPPLSSSTTETRTPYDGRTSSIPIPIPGAVPPPPPPPPSARFIRRTIQSRQALELTRNAFREASGGDNDDIPIILHAFSEDEFKKQSVPHLPFAEAFSSAPLDSDDFLANQLTKSLHIIHGSPHYGNPFGKRFQNSFLPHGSFPPKVSETNLQADVAGPSKHSRCSQFSAGDNWESQASSWIGQDGTESLSSENESEEDLFAYRNARQFPPQLPAHLSSHMSNPRSRSSATNKITNWVTQYEKSHSPARLRRPETCSALSGSETRATESKPPSDSSHTEVEQLWQQLKEGRARLCETRNRMTQIRQELRKLRWQKEGADNAFMTVVRPLLVGQRSDAFLSSLKLLDKRMADMLKLREEYHFMEASYERLEIELDEEEKELSGLETKFFSLLSAGQDKAGGSVPSPVRKNTTENAHHVEADTPYDLIGIQADRPLEDIHPLYVQFSDAVGDLENAKEDYRDLLMQHSQYEYERSLRESTGKAESADAQAFFAEFPADEVRMKESVEKLEDEVQRLKRQCEEKRVMKKHMSVQMAYVLEPNMSYEDLDLDNTTDILQHHHSLAHPRYMELLSQPDHLLASPWPMTTKQAISAANNLPADDPWKTEKQRLAEKEHSIETWLEKSMPVTKTNMVNKWLLNQLRISPVNVLLLQSVFGCSRLKIRDFWRWQCDVMCHWWSDTTAASRHDEHTNYITDRSEISEHRGTSRPSRAISEGDIRLRRKTVVHLKSSEMLRIT